MDISFTCDQCGKNIAIDEGTAGFTIDCPECGKAVYLPSPAPAKPKEAPVRVERKPLKRMSVPASSLRNDPLMPSYSGPEKSTVHPSIEAGVHCLLILVAIETMGFFATRQNVLWTGVVLYASTPFVFAPMLCAVYGMCVGHVKEGLLVLGGLALIIGLSCWLIFSPLLPPSAEGIQQMIKPLLR